MRAVRRRVRPIARPVRASTGGKLVSTRDYPTHGWPVREVGHARPMPGAVGNTVGRDGIPLRLRSAPCVPRRGPSSRCRGGVLRDRWHSGRVPWRAGRSRFPHQTGGGIPWLR